MACLFTRWATQRVLLTSYRRLPSSDSTTFVEGSLGIPDDIWLRIFSYFSTEERARISYVCRKWNTLCRDSKFWRTVNFQSCDIAGDITDTVVQAIVVYSSSIQVIDLSGSRCEHNITDNAIKHVALHCPSLRKLNLANRRKITNRGLCALARGCVYLEQLNLTGCIRVSDKGIKVVASKCTVLEILCLAYCTRITDKGVNSIAKKCANLTTLDLTGCTNITDRGMKALSRYCGRLTDITLKDTTDISIEGIGHLVRGSPNLTRVQLGIVQDTTQTVAALNIIVKHCSNLQFLSFQHYRTQNTQAEGSRKIVSKKTLGAFVSSLNACGFFI